MAANETIVFSIEEFDLRVLNRRIHAMPDTGVIATIEKGSPRAAITAGLFNTLKISIIKSSLYTATINVLPGSSDDAWLFGAAQETENSGLILTMSAVHQTSKWISDACVIMADPTVTFSSDGTEVNAWTISGNFPLVNMGKFVNPGTLTADQVTASLQ